MGKGKKSFRQRVVKWSVLLGFFCLVVIAATFYFYQVAISPVDLRKTQKRMFVVSPGEGLISVAIRLKEEDLIRNSKIFLLEARRMKLSNQIEAGDFKLSSAMELREIISLLTSGNVDVWVTIIPGWRYEQVSTVLMEKMTTFNTSWLKILQKNEGFLFPDSYLVPKTATSGGFLAIIRRNYKEKISSQIITQAKERGLNEQEMVILASLVEREAKTFDERRIVAGVLLNRLHNNWPLQVDATVQYVVASNNCGKEIEELCQWWPKVGLDNLRRIDSPYNTYLYRGLPPSPICNPSLHSIEAVSTAPLDSPYWYYLSDGEGKIHFSKTLVEHENNIKKFIK